MACYVNASCFLWGINRFSCSILFSFTHCFTFARLIESAGSHLCLSPPWSDIREWRYSSTHSQTFWYHSSPTRSRCSVICIVTRLRAGHSGVRIPAGVRWFISSPKPPDRAWDPPSFIFKGYRKLCPQVSRGRCMKLTTHFYLVSRLRTSGALPSLRPRVFLPLQSLTGSVELCATRGDIWNSSNCKQGAYVLKSKSKVILKAMTFPALLARQTIYV